MRKSKAPSEQVLKGRRALEFIKGVTLLKDLQWNEPTKQWVLHCSLFSDEIDEQVITKSTEWYVIIDENYPIGRIRFFPSKENSITQTFPHQLFNGIGEEEQPWRNGLLCLDTNVESLGRFTEDVEPTEEDTRLAWHAERAIQWLIAASTNTLTLEDEPFELVDFPESSSIKVGFSEGSDSFNSWKNSEHYYGIAEFSMFRPYSGIWLVREFKTTHGSIVREIDWGTNVTQQKKEQKMSGYWLLLKEVPYKRPWQAPLTWSEFHEICEHQGIDLWKSLRQLVNKQRDGLVHVLLIGFPIKNKLNDEDSEIFWQGIQLPILSYGNQVMKGFRLNEKGYWNTDRARHLNGTRKIGWMHSYNWSKQSVMSRGMLPKAISESSILQIGAGSLGSVTAELLTRAGVEKMGIIDYDTLEMGNITRHTLQLKDVKNSKAVALTSRLNQTSLHSKVISLQGSLKYNAEIKREELEKYDVILDCTGEDEVLNDLNQMQWTFPKRFISISLGYGGRRLFIFSSTGTHFPHNSFRRMINPWLREEEKEYANVTLPREGLGCWHPLFPARIDDVWMMASAGIKRLEVIFSDDTKSVLSVFEQQINDGSFEGIKLVSEEEYNE
jgi:hypothetical protein